MESEPQEDLHGTLSSSFKLKRSSTFHSKRPRLLEGLDYQHKYSEVELQMKLINYLTNKQHTEAKVIKLLEGEMELQTNQFFPKRAYDILPSVLDKIKSLPCLYYATLMNFKYMDSENHSRTNWDELYHWDKELMKSRQDFMFETFAQTEREFYDDIINGTKIL